MIGLILICRYTFEIAGVEVNNAEFTKRYYVSDTFHGVDVSERNHTSSEASYFVILGVKHSFHSFENVKICTIKDTLRRSSITFFHLKKTVAENTRLLVEAYGEQAQTQKACERQRKLFNTGDFDVKHNKR